MFFYYQKLHTIGFSHIIANLLLHTIGSSHIIANILFSNILNNRRFIIWAIDVIK
jgi:hypothetical protein